MPFEPRLIKFLKKNAMTTHDFSKILVDRMIVNKRHAKTKLILKDVQKMLKREIKRHKNIIICTGDIKQIKLYFDDVQETRDMEGDDEYGIMMDEMLSIFNFTNTNDNLYETIEEVIQHNIKYAMLTFMMNKYNKILKRFLLADINMVILSYV